MFDYQKIARKIRKSVIEMKFISQSSHIGSALSCIDILAVIYFKILNLNKNNLKDQDRDRFILSKGHAVSALYAVLAEKGFFKKKVLNNYCKNGSKLSGHPTKDCLPGIEVSTGSLGHGLPMGTGMALAGKGDKRKYRVFVLMSDGECDEGSNWEAALFASHHKLDNLVAIIDYNKFQAFGKTNEVLNLEPLKDKWVAFGWNVQEIDGHNFKEIEESLCSLMPGKPNIIIANTIKGKGVSFMEGKLEWHYKSLSKEEYETALKELSKK